MNGYLGKIEVDGELMLQWHCDGPCKERWVSPCLKAEDMGRPVIDTPYGPCLIPKGSTAELIYEPYDYEPKKPEQYEVIYPESFGVVPDKPLINVFLGNDRKVTESDLSMIIRDEVEPEPATKQAPVKELSTVTALTTVAAYPNH